MTERPPAVAGTFYPADPNQLAANIQDYLRSAKSAALPEEQVPKAILAPHAGYIYSGPVAASAYAQLRPFRDRIRRVVLAGPAHYVAFSGLAVPSVECFRTPLGLVPLDRAAIQGLLDLSLVEESDFAHAREHSLEVHLPFLQTVLDRFTLIPLLVGRATPNQVSQVLDRLWGAEDTLIVISSDLTHFHDYSEANHLDRKTANAIEHLDAAAIGPEDACGRLPIQGLLESARTHRLTPRLLDLRNSGDTAGSRNRVVGYGAFRFTPPQPPATDQTN